MTRRLAVVALALCCALATPAAAARHHAKQPAFNEVTRYCGERICAQSADQVVAGKIHTRRSARPPRSAAAADILARYAAHGATTDRNCLTSDTRATLEQAEAHFGVRFVLASTCRAGATIAGTNHPSWHAFGRAVDIEVPRAVSKAVLVAWLYKHAAGVVMTYRNMAHVHFDTGPYHKLVRGADANGARRHARRHFARHARL